MTELPDDELDKLFRKSSEEFDPTYEPEEWNALRKRLDVHDGKTTLYWLKKWWPFALLALMIPAWFGYHMLADSNEHTTTFNNTPATKAEAIGSLKKAEQVADQDAVKSPPVIVRGKVSFKLKSEDDKTPKVTLVASDNRNQARNNGRKKEREVAFALSPIVEEQPDIFRSKAEKKTSDTEKLMKQIPSEKQGIAKKAFSEQEDLLEQRESLSNKSNLYHIAEEIKPSIVSEELISPKTKLSLSPNLINHMPFITYDSLSMPDIEIPENDWKTTIEIACDLSPKMAIRFGYSPDMTTVGLKNFSKPGSAVSLMLEYSIFRKLYLQTGVVRSVKDYRANAGEYALNKYVTNINTPYSVDGICTMIEIPLGFRYDLVQRDRFRFFAGVGTSSYYVQNEKYTYHYEQYEHGQIPGWKGKTGWFLLSHVNASAGYEHRISNQLSILAEPYIQLPLKGVGYGKVNLITTGMWLSVRYTPLFNR